MNAENCSSAADLQSDVLRVFQTKDEIRSFYNKIAHVYDLLSEKAEQPMREIALQMLDPQPGEHLLEIGFGTGHMLVQLAQAVGPDGEVEGIDLAEKMIEQAQVLLQREGLDGRVHLIRGDAEQLPFGEAVFDGIFSSFTLELFDTPDIPKVLAECYRVLKPGGRMVDASISKEGKPGMVLRAFEWTHRHFPNLMDCRPIHVRRAMEAAGFEIRESRVELMWVPVEIVLGIKPA